ncbi:hypothetical protein DFQ27_006749 [Actinomortierella ambigua]|uniref:Uncharacterized protein n=1 Tax=Actinomortierella ambigua TaxID=1343610 RepID=A0A9P6PVH6_9FUNG|nr:hypothetical protein DFQ27_006749 [Actinomortierella ambigua]
MSLRLHYLKDGPAADAQEQARFHQIMQMQQQQYGASNQKGYYESYNRQGGMGAGAALALGVVGGAAVGMMAGSMLAGSMYNPGFDTVPADVAVPADSYDAGGFSGGDFGGGDFGGGDFGGGDFGGGF